VSCDDDQAMAPMVAGAVAELASLPFYLPTDIIAQRMALPGRPYNSSITVARDIW
jgi:hypothetical protein